MGKGFRYLLIALLLFGGVPLGRWFDKSGQVFAGNEDNPPVCEVCGHYPCRCGGPTLAEDPWGHFHMLVLQGYFGNPVSAYPSPVNAKPGARVDITIWGSGFYATRECQLRACTFTDTFGVCQFSGNILTESEHFTCTVASNYGTAYVRFNAPEEPGEYVLEVLRSDLSVGLTIPVIVWPDADGDGLSDYEEEFIYGTDPHNPDTDGDGLSDGDEVLIYGTNPRERDSDFDGLSDYDEIFVYGTDPLNADTDGDGIPDGLEVKYGMDPLDPADAELDFDGDGLTNYEECVIYGSDPTNPDTDGDGIPDGVEVAHGMDPTVPALLREYGGGYRYELQLLIEEDQAERWNVPEGADIALAGSCDDRKNGVYWQIENNTAAGVGLAFDPFPEKTAKIGFSIKSADDFSVAFLCTADNQQQYRIVLEPADADGWIGTPPELHIGQGGWMANDRWHWVVRDLKTELRKIDSTLELVTIDEVRFYGDVAVRTLAVYRYLDADGDCIPDTVEDYYGLDRDDPDDAWLDMDEDGLTNYHEFLYGSEMNAVDSDGDGFADGDEVKIYGSYPDSTDSDGDGLSDSWELGNFGNEDQTPDGDHDGDGFSNLEEDALGLPFDSEHIWVDSIYLKLYEMLRQR